MERCANCNKRILFGAVKTAYGAFCSADCSKGFRAALNGFCDACLAQTTDQSAGNMTQINGIGTMWGFFDKHKCPECGSVVKTKWFTFLFPLIPLDKYRVLFIQQKHTLTGYRSRYLARRLKPRVAGEPARQDRRPSAIPPVPARPKPGPPPVRPAAVTPVRERPPGVTVIAVASIVAAVGGLLLAALSLAANLMLLSQPAWQAGAANRLRSQIAYGLFTIAIDVALSAALLVGAVGILRLKRWARTTLLVRAILQMAFTLVQSSVAALIISETPAQPADLGVAAYAGLAVMALLSLAFNAALLVTLALPGVTRAFGASEVLGPPIPAP